MSDLVGPCVNGPHVDHILSMPSSYLPCRRMDSNHPRMSEDSDSGFLEPPKPKEERKKLGGYA